MFCQIASTILLRRLPRPCSLGWSSPQNAGTPSPEKAPNRTLSAGSMHPPVSQHELTKSKLTRLAHSTKDIHSSGRDNSRRNGHFWRSRAPQLCSWAAYAGELDSISFESLSRHVEPGRRSFRQIGWSGVCDLGDRRKQRKGHRRHSSYHPENRRQYGA